ncbi:MAG: DUF3794 domain-containing protein [Clostridia bacterium]
MEVRFNEIDAPRAAGLVRAQALVEGDIPFPEGKTATDILGAMGEVLLSGSDVKEGMVLMEGRVRVQLTCLDGQVFCFTSSAMFRHTLAAPEARPGMVCEVTAQLQTLSVKLVSGLITLSAVVDICCRLIDESSLPVLSGIAGICDMEIKQKELSLCKRSNTTETIRTRDEVNAGDIVEVLCADGIAELTDVAGCRGMLMVDALCRTSGGKLCQQLYNLPFTYSAIGSGGCADVSALSVRCLSSEFALIAVEAQIDIVMYTDAPMSLCLPLAAYSPSIPFTCITSRQCFCGSAGMLSSRHAIAESLSLPEGMPAVHHVVCCFARTVVTAQNVNDNRLYVEGLLVTRVIYHTESGAYFAFTEDVPFACDFDARGANAADVTLNCIASVRGSGSRISVDYTLLICAKLYVLTTVNVVTGIEECDSPDVRRGIIVYFCASGETMFDVAKRFNISTARLKESNPSVCDQLSDGERLMIIV